MSIVFYVLDRLFYEQNVKIICFVLNNGILFDIIV